MQRMINILHERYTQEQLDGMPQYQRLMSLYRDDRMDNVALHQQISMQMTLLIPRKSFRLLILHVRKC